jgi:hypothetical protein
MKTKFILKSSMLTGYVLIVVFAIGQNTFFAGDLAIGTSLKEAACPVFYAQSPSLVPFNEINYNIANTTAAYGQPLPILNFESSFACSVFNNTNYYSIDTWDSQNNISNFDGNGLRITSTGNAYSQDAITYQSGLSGGGAGIAFGRGGSWDTFMSFYTNQINNGGTGNIIERMRLDHNGNLGIGTIHPSEKLTVNGTIVARKVKVSIQEGDYADYVFASNYKLRSLTSVENFIKKYKHLPGVPSAEEVRKAGMDIGSSQVILLRKIEELTLYMLHQHDEIRKLKKQLSAISARKK